MTELERISATEIGERLRKARNTAGKSQDEAAAAIGVSRPTVVSIEKGQRKVKFDELETLAFLYNASVNRMLADNVVHVDMQARFRGPGADDAEATQAIATLSKLAAGSLELERLLGVRFEPSYPSEIPIVRGSIERQAEDAAMAQRHRLGLGLAPITDIVSLLENEVGIRVFIQDLPSKISGLFAYDPVIGACIVLNAKHPWVRRALTAAHEYGHFLTNRSQFDVVEINEKKTSVDERFANAFALAFLMPAQALRRRFNEILEIEGQFTPRHLALMAHESHVSAEAMCRRMENLELLPRGTYDSLRERGFDRDFIRGIVGDPIEPARSPISPRLAHLATAAHRKGVLSEGQLSRMLDIGRPRLRQLIDDLGGDEEDDLAIAL